MRYVKTDQIKVDKFIGGFSVQFAEEEATRSRVFKPEKINQVNPTAENDGTTIKLNENGKEELSGSVENELVRKKFMHEIDGKMNPTNKR